MQVRIHYDFGSPYAYLAWQRIRQHPERYAPARLAWIPVSAAHIFRMDGSAPNMTLPNQAKYLVEDLNRVSTALGVPFAPPPAGTPGAMPVRSIEAARMQFLADAEGKGDAWREAVYLAYFQDGVDISDRDVLDGLARRVGLSKGAEAADDAAHKKALVDATAKAYADGAPGVPFVLVEHSGAVERFWGQDRLSYVEQRIATVGGPIQALRP